MCRPISPWLLGTLFLLSAFAQADDHPFIEGRYHGERGNYYHQIRLTENDGGAPILVENYQVAIYRKISEGRYQTDFFIPTPMKSENGIVHTIPWFVFPEKDGFRLEVGPSERKLSLRYYLISEDHYLYA